MWQGFVQFAASSKNTKNSYDQIKGITLRGTSFYVIPAEREVKRCQKSDCHNDLEIIVKNNFFESKNFSRKENKMEYDK
jgi:hypothetical protein